jgi:hypothetical protein
MFKEYEFVVNLIAGLFLVSAQSIYIFQVVKKQITPSLFTWLGWSVLVGVALISQIIEYHWSWTLTGHLFSAIGCLLIFLFAFLSRNFVVRKKDGLYLYIGLGCVILYILFSDPWITTLFAILADGILGIPTIIKAFKEPKTEKTIGWNIALGCWTLTLITCFDKNILFALFPAYCFIFNAIMSFLTGNRRILKMQ